MSSARFQSLQAKLRTLFRRPALSLGLAAVEGDRVLVLNDASSHEHACIFADSAHHKTSEFAGSLYERAVRRGAARHHRRPRGLARPDADRGRADRQRCAELRLRAAPLPGQGDRHPGAGLAQSRRPERDAPAQARGGAAAVLHGRAAQRGGAEHAASRPSSRRNARRSTPRSSGASARPCSTASSGTAAARSSMGTEMEPIVFEDVYPLYGLADIRGSSVQRGLAIQADLLTQLRLAAAAVHARRSRRGRSPALDELGYRIDKHIAQIERSLNSGDEVADHRVPARARREPVRLPRRVRRRGARSHRRVPERARRAAGHRLPPAAAVRGERHAHRGGHLVRPRPRGAGRRRTCSRTTSRSRRRTASTTRSTWAPACSRTADSTRSA